MVHRFRLCPSTGQELSSTRRHPSLSFKSGSNPRQEGATRIQTETLPEEIPIGETRELSVTLPDQGDGFDLFVYFNDRGSDDLPFDTPVEFVVSELGRNRRERF